jgi:DNA invertase Pin-like site-specific DNA recombinase
MEVLVPRDRSIHPRPSTSPGNVPAPDHAGGDRRPQAPRGRGRRRPDRGLPVGAALIDLARTWLQVQRTLWPELVRDGALPGPDPAVLAAMAEQFRALFLSGTSMAYRSPLSTPPWVGVAGSYLRYSDPGSNPRSLDQQLKLQLEKARTNGHFIPWCYVFADAAVTGTTADRNGYILAKRSLGLEGMEVLYIDEIGRASRDAIESMQLGRLVAQRGKRLIGVSDNFDSSLQMSKMMLSFFATQQEWFVDQLRSKVRRGLDDAFGRGSNIFTAAVGYKLVPAVDALDRPILGKDGVQVNARAIDEEAAGRVLWAFESFARHAWSRPRIARQFNDWAVGGMKTWNSSAINNLLRRATYVGIET